MFLDDSWPSPRLYRDSGLFLAPHHVKPLCCGQSGVPGCNTRSYTSVCVCVCEQCRDNPAGPRSAFLELMRNNGQLTIHNPFNYKSTTPVRSDHSPHHFHLQRYRCDSPGLTLFAFFTSFDSLWSVPPAGRQQNAALIYPFNPLSGIMFKEKKGTF